MIGAHLERSRRLGETGNSSGGPENSNELEERKEEREEETRRESKPYPENGPDDVVRRVARVV